jgi:hypothetical protein
LQDSSSGKAAGASPGASEQTTAVFGGVHSSPSPATDVAGEAAGPSPAPTAPPEAGVARDNFEPARGPDFTLAAVSAAALLLGLALFGLRRALRTPR